MKIQEVEIERCGVWRQWKLPLAEGGIHVFQGPNEAGKTTLRRFIRGVLYGFPAQTNDPECVPLRPASGALRIAADGRTWRLHRATASDGTGDVTLFAGDVAEQASNRLESWFQGISEQIFEDVFSVGLRELQQLGTLSDNEAAERIYGITLGPEGQRLLEVSRRAAAARDRLIDTQSGSGKLIELFEERDQIQDRLESLKSQREEYTSLALRREQSEREISDLKKRQAGIQHELRGYKLLERAHAPWQQLQECQNRLDEIPDVRSFPEDGLEQLDKLDADLELANRTKQTLLSELQQWRKQSQITVSSQFRQHAAALQGLVAQRGVLEELTTQSETAYAKIEETDLTLAAAREQIDPEWTDAKLAAIDLTPAGYQRLTSQAESLCSARRRAASLKQACRRLRAAIRRRREILDVRLLELGGTSVQEAITVQRNELERLQQVVRLRESTVDLERRERAIHDHRTLIAPREQLPPWVRVMLVGFGIVGFGLGILGLITGVRVGAVAGCVYGLLAVTCLGFAAGLRWQYEQEVRQNLDELDTEHRENSKRLGETSESIARLTALPTKSLQDNSSDVDSLGADDLEGSADEAAPAEAPSIVIEDPAFQNVAAKSTLEREAISTVQAYLAELQEMGLAERKLRRASRNLKQLRTKREIARREVATATSHWTELMGQLKFPESLDPVAAHQLWRSLFDVLEARRRGDTAREQAAHVDSLINAFRHRIKEQGQQMQDFESDYDRPLDVLADWELQLGELAGQRQKRREFRDRILARRREIRQFLRHLSALRSQRNVLLVRGGATNREEFEQRAEWSVQLAELELEQETLNSSLDTIQSEFSDIAIVEEDLRKFDAEDNTRAIEALEHESDNLTGDLEQEFERLGSLKHEISRLEEDDQAATLQFELAQATDRIERAIQEWQAVETAAQTIDQIRHHFERNHQPEMLRTASRFLEKLTLGKYHTVWMPLGQRILQIDDEHGQTMSIERLSRGTREQLFLAVRLAVVQDLSGRGIHLPLILDDIFVNFDEQRTDAALDLLTEFATRGQQILFFTCHKTLAQQFSNRGAQTVTLPSHAIENPGGQRLAG